MTSSRLTKLIHTLSILKTLRFSQHFRRSSPGASDKASTCILSSRVSTLLFIIFSGSVRCAVARRTAPKIYTNFVYLFSLGRTAIFASLVVRGIPYAIAAKPPITRRLTRAAFNVRNNARYLFSMIPRGCALYGQDKFHEFKHALNALFRSQFKEIANLGFHRLMLEAVEHFWHLGHILLLPNS